MKAGVPRTNQTMVMAHHVADSKSVTIPAAYCSKYMYLKEEQEKHREGKFIDVY